MGEALVDATASASDRLEDVILGLLRCRAAALRRAQPPLRYAWLHRSAALNSSTAMLCCDDNDGDPWPPVLWYNTDRDLLIFTFTSVGKGRRFEDKACWCSRCCRRRHSCWGCGGWNCCSSDNAVAVVTFLFLCGAASWRRMDVSSPHLTTPPHHILEPTVGPTFLLNCHGGEKKSEVPTTDFFFSISWR